MQWSLSHQLLIDSSQSRCDLLCKSFRTDRATEKMSIAVKQSRSLLPLRMIRNLEPFNCWHEKRWWTGDLHRSQVLQGFSGEFLSCWSSSPKNQKHRGGHWIYRHLWAKLQHPGGCTTSFEVLQSIWNFITRHRNSKDIILKVFQNKIYTCWVLPNVSINKNFWYFVLKETRKVSQNLCKEVAQKQKFSF